MEDETRKAAILSLEREREKESETLTRLASARFYRRGSRANACATR